MAMPKTAPATALLSFSPRQLMHLGNLGNRMQAPAAAAEPDAATSNAAATADECDNAATAVSDEDLLLCRKSEEM